MKNFELTALLARCGRVASAFALTSVLMSTSVSAALVTYTDEASFLSAISGMPEVSIESFESFTATNSVLASTSLSGVDFDLTTADSFGVFSGPSFGTAPQDGSQHIVGRVNATLDFAFNNALKAFGFYITDYGDNSAGNLELTIGGETIVLATSGGGDGSVAFFGIVENGTDTFNSASLIAFNDAVGIDKVYTAHMPVPAALPLMMVGLGAMGAARRRR